MTETMVEILAIERRERRRKAQADKAAEVWAQQQLAEFDPVRPALVVGRYKYDLDVATGRIWLWSAVGKSGRRWALEPYSPRVADLPRREREWCEARLGPEAVAHARAVMARVARKMAQGARAF